MDVASGFSLSLVLAALLLGLRHGIDWDHIAAITDITATQTPRRGFLLGTLYALGHAGAVLTIGIIAIVAGRNLPPAVDRVMGIFVGWSLVALGAWVLFSLVRDRGEFRLQSRWMLLFGAVRKITRRIKGDASTELEHDHLHQYEHEHEHAALEDVHHHHSDQPADTTGHPLKAPTHRHVHHHHGEFAASYGRGSSVGVGLLHGIGAETPTQVLIFLAAANAGGKTAGVAVLITFLVGLLISNTALVLLSSFGFKVAGRRRKFQVVLGTVTGFASLVIGGLLVAGKGAVLPAFFTG